MTEHNADQDGYKPKRFRSPPYPFIPLDKAIGRASALHDKALHHLVPLHVAATAWGVTTKSSILNSTIAALKQFGLLKDHGSGGARRVQLTDDAIRILKDPDPLSEKKQAAIKRCALSPRIHNELWEKFGEAGLSENMLSLIKSYLTLDRKDAGDAPFSDTAADELIEEYRATASYAGLDSAHFTSTHDEIDEDEKECAEDKMPEPKLDDRDTEFVQKTAAKNAKNLKEPPEFEVSSAWKEVTSVSEGPVVLQMPATLSVESVEEIEQWLEFIKSKLKRRAT